LETKILNTILQCIEPIPSMIQEWATGSWDPIPIPPVQSLWASAGGLVTLTWPCRTWQSWMFQTKVWLAAAVS